MSEATASRYCPHCRKDVKVTKAGQLPALLGVPAEAEGTEQEEPVGGSVTRRHCDFCCQPPLWWYRA